MDKEFWIKLSIVVVLLICVFCCVNSSTEPSPEALEQRSISGYNFWETDNSEEYTKFLNELDSNNNREIVSVSCSSYAYQYTGPFNIYTVMYKECEKTDIHYKYYIFETEKEEDYWKFMKSLSDEFEIFDISIGSYAFQYTGPFHTFIVTYRKAL